MIKTLVVGIWVLIVTLGASFGTVAWKKGQSPTTATKEFFGGLDYVKSDLLSVPVVAKGSVQGYAIAQFVFTIDGVTAAAMSIPPKILINDAAFKALYDGSLHDFEHLERYDLDVLSKVVRDTVNKRLGEDLVRDVLIEQLSYVAKKDIRNGSQPAHNVKITPPSETSIGDAKNADKHKEESTAGH